MKYTTEIKRIVDQRRRDLINGKMKTVKGELSEMYYEGMRVAYQEVQDIIERWEAIEVEK
jgi:hypothetical protein